jgi:hypothetical protein
MKKRTALLPAIVLIVAACGSDDGGSDLTDDQQAAVDQLLDESQGEVVFDQDCVEEKATELSAEDAAAIADAGPDGNPELSEEGDALTLELLECVDNEALVDQFIIGLQESGEDFDEQCARDALEDFDMSDIAVGGQEGDMPEELVTGLLGCFQLDLGS